MPHNQIKFREDSLETYDSGYSNPNGIKSSMNQYVKSLQAPFNSISPRFNYNKKTVEGMQMPGPGSYTVVNHKSPSQMDKSAAFRAASRDKDSEFGKIVRRINGNPGPGSYNSNSTLVKKTFNANLAK
jgi:hypothetical protein